MVQTHASDYSNHFFMGQADPISGAPSDTVERCLNGLKNTYESIDRMIGRLAALADEDTLVAIVSDHGATPNVNGSTNVAEILEKAGLLLYKGTPANQDAARTGPSGPGQVPDLVSWDVMKQTKREVDLSRSKAVPEGSIDIHIPVKGREPYGHVDPVDYRKVQREIIEALLDYKHPQTGERPFALVLPKDEAEIINLWGPECGDVVYALRPDYDGVHGRHLPTSSLGIGSQHSTFVLAGPGVKAGIALNRPVRVVDVAPTLCHLLGWPVPRDAEGAVVYEALEDPDWYLADH
jgi:predicted AlkP superfamily phosphohydrolase/phosphomutase